MVERVHVALPGGRGYDILIGQRLLAEAGAHIAPFIKEKRVIVVTDETVARRYLHAFSNALSIQGITCTPVIVPPGEGSKSLTQLGKVLETILELSITRNTVLVALGGGVIGDLTGFAASILLRGIDFIQIPTTLLAQVDSSVGGKTGVNAKTGKNLIGSFHQPLLVLADVAALATLPERERKAGYAEIVKYGLIRDAAFFDWCEQNGAKVIANDAEAVTYAVKASCEHKAQVVAADEKEQGERALLNFGHTFGHALEAETGYSDVLLHGEAVAIGMVLAHQFSTAPGLCPETDTKRVIAHFKSIGLMTSPLDVRKDWDVDAIMHHFTRDKKATQNSLNFILTRGIGKAYVAKDVAAERLREFLQQALK